MVIFFLFSWSVLSSLLMNQSLQAEEAGGGMISTVHVSKWGHTCGGGEIKVLEERSQESIKCVS